MTRPANYLDPQVVRNVLASADRLALSAPMSRHQIDYGRLSPLTGVSLNNAGDVWSPLGGGLTGQHVRGVERGALETLAEWFGMPERWWGYVGPSSTDAVLHAVRTGLARHPDAVLYHSDRAHRCVPLAGSLLRLPGVALPTCTDGPCAGAIDIERAERLIDAKRPAIVVATLGATVDEALDDVTALRALFGPDAYLHGDGALSGLYLALSPATAPRMGPDGLDSVSFSTHKFLHTPSPGGVFLGAARDVEALIETVPYLSQDLATLATSRSGHNVLQLALALETGRERLHEIYRWWRERAAHVARRLAEVTAAHRHPHALAITFPRPAERIMRTYRLMPDGDRARVIIMPGTPRDAIMFFLAEMKVWNPARGIWPSP